MLGLAVSDAAGLHWLGAMSDAEQMFVEDSIYDEAIGPADPHHGSCRVRQWDEEPHDVGVLALYDLVA